MEGKVDILYYFENFTPEFLYIETAVLMILLTTLVFIWLYNKKRYNALKHQIPAGVVKNYLDSIIQNSSALKSSLFRDNLDASGLPSVMPISNLPGGDSIQVSSAGPGDDSARRNAELAALQAQLAEKLQIIKELESRLSNMPSGNSDGGDTSALEAQLKVANDEIERLKNSGDSSAAAAGGVDEGVHSQVVSERDELAEKLKEYEVIEDDLANLKRLKQENEQLKRSLGQEGGETQELIAEAPEPEDMIEPEPEEPVGLMEEESESVEEEVLEAEPEEPVLEEISEPEPEAEEEVLEAEAEEPVSEEISEPEVEEETVEAAAEEEEVALDAPDPAPEPVEAASDEDKKTPEDLLSEFEKMLG